MNNNRDKEIIKKLMNQIKKLSKIINKDNKKEKDNIKYIVCEMCKRDFIPNTENNVRSVPNINEEEYNIDEDECYYNEEEY